MSKPEDMPGYSVRFVARFRRYMRCVASRSVPDTLLYLLLAKGVSGSS